MAESSLLPGIDERLLTRKLSLQSTTNFFGISNRPTGAALNRAVTANNQTPPPGQPGNDSFDHTLKIQSPVLLWL